MEREKTVSIDTETTGLKLGVHEIIQISVNIYTTKSEGGLIRLKVVDSFDSLVRPLKPYLADPIAMKKNNLSLGKLMIAPLPQQIRNAFFQWHEEVALNCKLVPLGQNFSFDQGFLKIFFGDYYDSIFSYSFDDTKVLARSMSKVGLIHPKGFSLTKLCEYFVIYQSTKHEASSDALCTLKVYEKMLNLLSHLNKEKNGLS